MALDLIPQGYPLNAKKTLLPIAKKQFIVTHSTAFLKDLVSNTK